MGRKMRIRTLKVKSRQINYVRVGDRMPFAFWIEGGKIHVSLINNVDYEVNVIGAKSQAEE